MLVVGRAVACELAPHPLTTRAALTTAANGHHEIQGFITVTSRFDDTAPRLRSTSMSARLASSPARLVGSAPYETDDPLALRVIPQTARVATERPTWLSGQMTRATSAKWQATR